MHGDTGVRGVSPVPPMTPGPATSRALAGAARSLAASLLLGGLLLLAGVFLMVVWVGRASAAAGGMAVAGRSSTPPAAGTQGGAPVSELQALEALGALDPSLVPEGLRAAALAGGLAGERAGSGPGGQSRGSAPLPVPLSWAVPQVRIERGLPRPRPEGPGDGDPMDGNAGAAPVALLPVQPSSDLAALRARPLGAGFPGFPGLAGVAGDPGTGARLAAASTTSGAVTHSTHSAWVQALLYAALHRKFARDLGFTRPNPFDELPGLMVADTLTQLAISNPEVAQSYRAALETWALITASVFAMNWANQKTFLDRRVMDTGYRLSRIWTAMGGASLPDFPFFAPRSPLAVSLIAGGQIVLDGPLKHSLLPPPDTALHYWENWLYDMGAHFLPTLAVMGTLDYYARGGYGLAASPPVRGWVSRLSWGAVDLTRWYMTSRQSPGWLSAIRRWSEIRYALTAAGLAAFGKGVSELIAHPPPGYLGSVLREMSAVVDRIRWAPSRERPLELAASLALNLVEWAWLTGWEGVRYGVQVVGSPVMVALGSVEALERMVQVGRLTVAAVNGDREGMRRAADHPSLEFVPSDVKVRSVVAESRMRWAVRGLAAWVAPARPAGQPPPGPAPAGGGSREELVAAARAQLWAAFAGGRGVAEAAPLPDKAVLPPLAGVMVPPSAGVVVAPPGSPPVDEPGVGAALPPAWQPGSWWAGAGEPEEPQPPAADPPAVTRQAVLDRQAALEPQAPGGEHREGVLAAPDTGTPLRAGLTLQVGNLLVDDDGARVQAYTVMDRLSVAAGTRFVPDAQRGDMVVVAPDGTDLGTVTELQGRHDAPDTAGVPRGGGGTERSGEADTPPAVEQDSPQPDEPAAAAVQSPPERHSDAGGGPAGDPGLGEVSAAG
ncbi:MAG TPA: hypothetical protein VKG45_00975 [Actinomycetes bacterium]|nr:hypothetical protein [Actinomycetes bacterium]